MNKKNATGNALKLMDEFFYLWLPIMLVVCVLVLATTIVFFN